MTRLPTDLLGHPIPPPTVFRQDGRRRKIGYAAKPGTGPKKQRCGTCKYSHQVTHRGVTTHKCELMAVVWNHSVETDINLRAPACDKWERKPFKRQEGHRHG